MRKSLASVIGVIENLCEVVPFNHYDEDGPTEGARVPPFFVLCFCLDKDYFPYSHIFFNAHSGTINHWEF